MAVFNYDPINGLNDTVVFPSSPTSEAAARQQFMTLFNQIKNYLNSGQLDAESLGGKQSGEYLLTANANRTFAAINHGHDYAASSHGHMPGNCGFSWGTGAPNNSDGRGNGSIYYRIEG